MESTAGRKQSRMNIRTSIYHVFHPNGGVRMRIVIAPQSLKGSLTAAQAGEAIAQGVRTVYPEAEIEIVPVADGGEVWLTPCPPRPARPAYHHDLWRGRVDPGRAGARPPSLHHRHWRQRDQRRRRGHGASIGGFASHRRWTRDRAWRGSTRCPLPYLNYNHGSTFACMHLRSRLRRQQPPVWPHGSLGSLWPAKRRNP